MAIPLTIGEPKFRLIIFFYNFSNIVRNLIEKSSYPMPSYHRWSWFSPKYPSPKLNFTNDDFDTNRMCSVLWQKIKWPICCGSFESSIHSLCSPKSLNISIKMMKFMPHELPMTNWIVFFFQSNRKKKQNCNQTKINTYPLDSYSFFGHLLSTMLNKYWQPTETFRRAIGGRCNINTQLNIWFVYLINSVQCTNIWMESAWTPNTNAIQKQCFCWWWPMVFCI